MGSEMCIRDRYNVADDTVFYMNMMGEFFKVNSDGTGLESQGALAQ